MVAEVTDVKMRAADRLSTFQRLIRWRIQRIWRVLRDDLRYVQEQHANSRYLSL